MVEKNCDENVGINQYSVGTATIFPNPVYNELTVSNIEENAVIVIYDLDGKMLMSRTAISKSEKINVSSLSLGLYIVKVINKNLTITSKMIKQ